jgi:hypothetical protein
MPANAPAPQGLHNPSAQAHVQKTYVAILTSRLVSKTQARPGPAGAMQCPSRESTCGCRRARLARRCRTRRVQHPTPALLGSLGPPWSSLPCPVGDSLSLPCWSLYPAPGTLTMTRERRPACYFSPDIHPYPSRTEACFPAAFATGTAASAAAPESATATACRCQVTGWLAPFGSSGPSSASLERLSGPVIKLREAG